MDKYNRICCYCCAKLEDTKSCPAAFLHILTPVKRTIHRLACAKCAIVFAVQKAEDELRQRKREIKVKFWLHQCFSHSQNEMKHFRCRRFL